MLAVTGLLEVTLRSRTGWVGCTVACSANPRPRGPFRIPGPLYALCLRRTTLRRSPFGTYGRLTREDSARSATSVQAASSHHPMAYDSRSTSSPTTRSRSERHRAGPRRGVPGRRRRGRVHRSRDGRPGEVFHAVSRGVRARARNGRSRRVRRGDRHRSGGSYSRT